MSVKYICDKCNSPAVGNVYPGEFLLYHNSRIPAYAPTPRGLIDLCNTHAKAYDVMLAKFLKKGA